MPRLNALALLSLATLFVPAFAESANPARPGTVNYIEGQAALGGDALTQHSVGSAALEAGQQVSTADGRVEILLTPGVYLRVGENSTVQMISPDLLRTEVGLDRGTAELEVDRLYPQNNLLVDLGATGASQSRIEKPGLYEFNAQGETVRVLDGRAEVRDTAGKEVNVKSGHLLAVDGESGKTSKFDRNHYTDALTDWSDLRADYLGQANQAMAERYAGGGAYTAGWAWDPAFYGYTWLPGDGLFYSPFGYGFYSPLAWYGGGFYGGGFYGGGLYGGGFHRGGFYRGGAGYGAYHGSYGGLHGTTFAGHGEGFGSGGGVHPGFAGGGGGGGFHGGGGGGFHGR